MDFETRIEITPGIRSGKPCIKGTRITVYDVLEYLAGGMTQAQLLDDFQACSRTTSRQPWRLPRRVNGAWWVYRLREAAA